MSLYALLANNYRNESLWYWSWYFCIDICERGGVLKAMAVKEVASLKHTIGRMSKIFKEAGVIFRKQMCLNDKEVSVHRILASFPAPYFLQTQRDGRRTDA